MSNRLDAALAVIDDGLAEIEVPPSGDAGMTVLLRVLRQGMRTCLIEDVRFRATLTDDAQVLLVGRCQQEMSTHMLLTGIRHDRLGRGWRATRMGAQRWD